MKSIKFLLLIILISLSTNIFSQEIKVGDIIKLSNYVKSENTPTALNSFADMNITAEYIGSYKYKVIEIGEKTVRLVALDFDELKKKSSRKDLSKIYNNKIYTISKINFLAFAKKSIPKDRFSIGLLTLPFKARPQDDVSFDTEFNLSSTLNIRIFDVVGSSFNYQIGAGIGSVGLNTSNASGLSDDEAQDVATLTFLNGIMLQYKRVQVGLYVGIDFINNQKNYQWESNGNLWVGFGIGYSLFNISISNEKNKQ